MGNGHAERILQPSQFSRTIGCPGWGNTCAGVKPKPSSIYADEGSAAHYLGEKCLRENEDAAHMMGKKISVGEAPNLRRFEVDDDMAEAVQVYLDEVRRKRAAMTGATFMIEQRLDLSWMIPGMFGTGDHVAVEPLGCVYVDDYKHGKGVAVEVGDKVGDNVQLSIYGLGAIGSGNPHGVEEVEVTVIQPRASHPAGRIRSVRFDADELIAWGRDVIAPAALAATKPDALVRAGDWCRWCDALDICPEARRHALEAAGSMFDDAIVPVEPKKALPLAAGLTGEQLGRVIEFAGIFEVWLKAVKAEGLDRLERGAADSPEHFKLVQGKLGNRAWADEKKVCPGLENHLPRNEIYSEPKIKSPAQMEKSLKAAGNKPKDAKEILANLITRPPGKHIMVPETDKRPAVAAVIDEMFDKE